MRGGQGEAVASERWSSVRSGRRQERSAEVRVRLRLNRYRSSSAVVRARDSCGPSCWTKHARDVFVKDGGRSRVNVCVNDANRLSNASLVAGKRSPVPLFRARSRDSQQLSARSQEVKMETAYDTEWQSKKVRTNESQNMHSVLPVFSAVSPPTSLRQCENLESRPYSYIFLHPRPTLTVQQ